MVLFLIWLAVFLLAIGVLTNVLVATAIDEDIQGRLAPMSDGKFRRTFVAWSIIMVLVDIGWVIWMSWPKRAKRYHLPVEPNPSVALGAAHSSLWRFDCALLEREQTAQTGTC
jgi:hypothetical protein